MNLETAVGQIRTVLDAITNFPTPGYTPIHPDVLIKQSISFPWAALGWSDELPGFIDSDHRWTIPKNSRAEIELHLVITSKSSNHFTLDLIQWAKKIEDALKNYSELDSTEFNLCVSRHQPAYDYAGKWAWLISTITIGSYKVE